jgi:amidase
MVSLLHKVAAQKRGDREAKLSAYCASHISIPDSAIDLSQYPLSKLAETERAIVQCDATRIVELIRKRVHTAENVLMAFVKVAIAAQDITNCLSEVCLEEAFVRARELDHHLHTTGCRRATTWSTCVNQGSHQSQMSRYFVGLPW